MFAFCESISGSFCYYSFFLSITAAPILFCVALFQYRVERLYHPSTPKNLTYYGRRANPLASLCLFGFAIKVQGEIVYVYQFGELLINTVFVLLLLVVALACNYCIIAIQEINRIPLSHNLWKLVFFGAVLLEAIEILGLSLTVYNNRYWPTLIAYAIELLAQICLPVIIAIKVRQILQMMKDTFTRQKNDGDPETDKLSRFKSGLMIVSFCIVCSCAFQLYIVWSTITTLRSPWMENRKPANAISISIETFGVVTSIWYAWIRPETSTIAGDKESCTVTRSANTDAVDSKADHRMGSDLSNPSYTNPISASPDIPSRTLEPDAYQVHIELTALTSNESQGSRDESGSHKDSQGTDHKDNQMNHDSIVKNPLEEPS